VLIRYIKLYQSGWEKSGKMSEYEHMVSRQRKWMFYLLALIVLGIGFSSYTYFFNGLLLGTIVSFYNLWNLQRKIRRFGESALESNKPILGIGTFTRMLSAGLAILIAIQFKAHFHIIGVILGLISSYVIIVIDFGIRTFSREK